MKKVCRSRFNPIIKFEHSSWCSLSIVCRFAALKLSQNPNALPWQSDCPTNLLWRFELCHQNSEDENNWCMWQMKCNFLKPAAACGTYMPIKSTRGDREFGVHYQWMRFVFDVYLSLWAIQMWHVDTWRQWLLGLNDGVSFYSQVWPDNLDQTWIISFFWHEFQWKHESIIS